MRTLVVLLRGVNVGGAGTTLPMGLFRQILTGIGCADVATYIQSGNAVLRSAMPPGDLAGAVAEAVTLPNGTHPAVFVLTLPELEAALEANPFPQAEAAPKSLHLMFLDRDAAPDLAALQALRADDEAFALSDRIFYLYAPGGIGRSKLAGKMGLHFGGAVMTARNLATVRTLVDMGRALPG